MSRYIVENNKIYDSVKKKYISVNNTDLIEKACKLLNEISYVEEN